MEELTKDDLSLNIRSAHRLVAAYYQRLIPTLNTISHDLDIDFYCWTPSEFDSPCRLTSDITQKWQWDLLPGLSTRYLYKSFENPQKAKLGEYLIEFFVISDTGVLQENDPKNHRSQPDAINLSLPVEQAESVVRIQLYTPYKEQDKNWYLHLWNRCDEPNLTKNPHSQKTDEDLGLMISGFEVPLTALMSDESVGLLTDRIKNFRKYLLTAAAEAHQVSEATIPAVGK